MKWRIYRLPGSRKFWHIDSGPGSPIINVHAIRSVSCPFRTIDIGCASTPRAWFEVEGELIVTSIVPAKGNALATGYDAPELIVKIADFSLPIEWKDCKNG